MIGNFTIQNNLNSSIIKYAVSSKGFLGNKDWEESCCV